MTSTTSPMIETNSFSEILSWMVEQGLSEDEIIYAYDFITGAHSLFEKGDDEGLS